MQGYKVSRVPDTHHRQAHLQRNGHTRQVQRALSCSTPLQVKELWQCHPQLQGAGIMLQQSDCQQGGLIVGGRLEAKEVDVRGRDVGQAGIDVMVDLHITRTSQLSATGLPAAQILF